MTKKNTKKNAAEKKVLYTAYLVTSRTGRSFLNQRVYTGRREGVWGPMEDSFIFRSKSAASKCAYDVNRRSDAAEPVAFVVPALLERRAPRRRG